MAHDEWYDKCKTRLFGCTDPDCWATCRVRGDVFFHSHYDGKGYIYNSRTGEKLIRHIAWIAKPLGKDSLVCFSNGKKRGYFSKNTGRVVIEPKYDHAWVFSDGLASVDLVAYQESAGSITRAATVLSELVEKTNFEHIGPEFVKVAPVACFQRLGYILNDVLEETESADALHFVVVGGHCRMFRQCPPGLSWSYCAVKSPLA